MNQTVLEKIKKAVIQVTTDENKKHFRNEYKYLLDPYKYKQCRNLCERYMQKDENADENGNYQITSVYFDSLNSRDYFDKESGALDRKKIRIRSYNHNQDSTYLELKRKIEIFEYKEKVHLDREQTLKMISGDFSPLYDIGTVKALNFYVEMQSKIYRPVSTVEYLRTALVLPFENVRITFDQNICFNAANYNIFDEMVMTPVFPDGQTVLEIKYNSILPGWIKRMMKNNLLTYESVSKYNLARKYYL